MNSWDASWNSMMSGIRKRLFPRFPKPRPSASKYPLGLSGQEIKDLQDLSRQPEWAVYRKACDALYDLTGRNILAGGCSEKQYQYQTGFLAAIETLATLPDSLTTVMTRVQDDDRRRQPGRDTSRSRIFYGTPFWDPSMASAGDGPEAVGEGQDG